MYSVMYAKYVYSDTGWWDLILNTIKTIMPQDVSNDDDTVTMGTYKYVQTMTL